MEIRRIALLAIIITLVLLIGCGGGISQTKYDSAVAEKDKVKSQLTEIKNELVTTQNEIVKLKNSGDVSAFTQNAPTDLSRVSWHPLTYVDKKYGFKVAYPDTWKITTRGTANVPVEIQYNSEDMVPGSWVGLITDTADTKYTQSTLVSLVSGWADYQFITSGDTVLVDNKTPAAYVEFIATIDTYLMHIYAVGYVDGDYWTYFGVWTIESVVPWDGNLMRQIAHTINKATADEIASATTTPPTTTRTTNATTTATTAAVSYTTYTDPTYKFTFKYNSSWTAWDPATDTTGHRLFGAASAQWICPGVRIDKLPAPTASTLFDLIPFVLGKQSNPEKSSTAEITNSNGIKATAHVIRYNSPTDGYRLDAKVYGFIKNGEWWTMVVYQSDGLGTLQGQNPDQIFDSWQFTQ